MGGTILPRHRIRCRRHVARRKVPATKWLHLLQLLLVRHSTFSRGSFNARHLSHCVQTLESVLFVPTRRGFLSRFGNTCSRLSLMMQELNWCVVMVNSSRKSHLRWWIRTQCRIRLTIQAAAWPIRPAFWHKTASVVPHRSTECSSHLTIHSVASWSRFTFNFNSHQHAKRYLRTARVVLANVALYPALSLTRSHALGLRQCSATRVDRCPDRKRTQCCCKNAFAHPRKKTFHTIYGVCGIFRERTHQTDQKRQRDQNAEQ